ncbi:MAG: hypothetical protein K0Q55_894 [Verrucomicrobia bacterium]|nr:hypothetical protein [Verrucomicrobiota bacterium]
MLKLLDILSTWVGVFLIFGLPWMIFRRQAKNGQPDYALRFFMSVIAVWGALIVHRLFMDLPIRLEMAQARGDLMYDGVGGNVGILVSGWLPGILGALCAYLGIVSRKRKSPSADA